MSNRPLINGDPRRPEQPMVLRSQRGWSVGEDNDVITPAAQKQRGMHRPLTIRHDSKWLITDLPAMTERAVKHRPSPKIL
ncbi:hypothetical protein MINTM003_14540 [Mycobacterium paraintracellulare]|nr:hypothetical protein MINTM003_14540 [Mycobacterium paraintracellulare]BCO88199.1 hypothetical protein MINTM015_14560 [Mycobacterium paraintracellulare]